MPEIATYQEYYSFYVNTYMSLNPVFPLLFVELAISLGPIKKPLGL